MRGEIEQGRPIIVQYVNGIGCVLYQSVVEKWVAVDAQESQGSPAPIIKEEDSDSNICRASGSKTTKWKASHNECATVG